MGLDVLSSGVRVMSDNSQRENVIDLRAASKARRSKSSARLPAAVLLLKEKTTYMLQSSLLALFDSADDTLFELADKSDNNQDQTTYFESMRQVRLCRRDIENRFVEYVHEAFDSLGNISAVPVDDLDYEIDMNNLSLVNNDQLEQNVAVDAMVNKAIEAAPESLQHITLRLDSLVPAKVYQRNNPIGPHQICFSFMRACEQLDTNIKVKLVLLKLFDRHLVGELPSFYDLANELMISRNVLPSLTTGRPYPPVNRAPTPSPSPNRAAPNARPARPTTAHTQSKEVLATLRNLLAGDAVPGGAGGPSGRPPGPPVSEGDASGVVISEASLLQLLTQIQVQQRHSPEAIVGLDIHQLQSLVNAHHHGVIGQLDRDVISLINLLFEFIVQDRNLAAEMKALLSRLQIPLLKVAIADKTFFDHSSHPAKRLLNEMATSALGWSPNQSRRDNLFGKIEATVNRICDDPDVNHAVFDEMLMDFLSFVDKEKKQAAVLEKRTLDAEAGKAKAETAREQVASVLSKLKGVDQLSVPMNSLVHEAWANVMFLIALKDGVDSPQWNSAHSTVRNLVWSLTVDVTSLNRVRLVKLLPELLKRLRSGLESIGHNAYDTGKLFKSLEQEHLLQLRGKPASPVAPSPAQPSAAGQQQAKQTSPSQIDVPPAVKPGSGNTLSTNEKGEVFVELTDAVITPRPRPEQPSEPPAQASEEASPSASEAEPESQFLEQVDSLSQGSWFELHNGEAPVRCRLAAIIKPVGKYIFVNRNGMKVAEQERKELAHNIAGGKVRLLDNSMLFDRALESVISDLRKSREEKR